MEFKRKFFILCAMCMVTFASSAYHIKVGGIYYSVLSTTDLTCEVTSGEEKYAGEVIIPSEVEYNNKKISVVGIAASAFFKCTSLAAVAIPNSVTSIGVSAFEGCTSLASITIPNSITSIIDRAFYDCRSLASITIPNSVTSIGPRAFSGCTSLAAVTIPNSVTSIGVSAFEGCASLASITIPNSVTSIGPWAFSGCETLLSIKLPAFLSTIKYGLFKGCKSLESIEVSGGVKYLEQYATDNNGYYEFDPTFGGCQNLNKLSLLYSEEILVVGRSKPDGSIIESKWSKDWTKRIKYLYMDRPLASNIPVPNLEKLELGASVKVVQIDQTSKWDECKSLTTIVSNALIPPTLGYISTEQIMNVNVIVPEEAIDAYKSDPVWGKFWNLQSGIDSITMDSTKKLVGRYDISGTPVDENFKGIVIMRFSDGSTKKMVVQ